ncbi:hypothetical protein BDZ89DRAFT_1074293 [Hymenopellis radicata]|nr:hypothetical protein BDZ89DRAFT_1074293 [Hymenopellis radicata]
MSRLPQEILDEIIDHNHNDRKALWACSLVSRACSDTSRRHLFSCIQLLIWAEEDIDDYTVPVLSPGHSCPNFHRLLVMSPHIAHLVISLKIYLPSTSRPLDTELYDPYLPSILSSLHHVRKFLLSGGPVVTDWDEFSLSFQDSLIQFWTARQLESFILDGINADREIIPPKPRGDAWSSLRHLALLWTDLDCFWNHEEGSVIPLQSLTLGGLKVVHHLTTALEKNMATFDVHQLRELNAILDVDEDFALFNRFLYTLSDTLEELCLDVTTTALDPGNPSTQPRSVKLDMSTLTHLQSVYLVLEARLIPRGGIPSSIQTIRILVILDPTLNVADSPWAALDTWLGDQLQNLVALKSVTIELHYGTSDCALCNCVCAVKNAVMSDKEVYAAVRREMPLLKERSILSIRHNTRRLQWGAPGALRRWIMGPEHLYKN